jgi:glucose/arabinose dehydrogenase
MRRIGGAFCILGLALFVAGCDKWFDEHVGDGGVGERAVTVASHLDTPWEMCFAKDGRLFFTQRPGAISIMEPGKAPKVWLKLDSVVLEVGESGLFGIALDPSFEANGYFYFAYTYAASKSPLKLFNKLVRYREDKATGNPVFDRVLLDSVDGNFLHNMGALEFGPDGTLFCTVGEHFSPPLAQELTSLNGKILRMTRDGEVPADNPFPNSYVYSLGHRNPQGLAFQPGTGELWSTEHGPSEEQGCCMDEINHIKPGRNYGWPIIRGNQHQAGLETPVYYSGDTVTWAPTGGIFIKNGDWKGSLVFTGLRGQALYRAVFDSADPNRIEKVERYLYRKFGRLRNVAERADGTLYIAVSNQDGRGDPLSADDRIIAMKPADIAKIP